MSFLAMAGLILGAAGLFASILGAWLSYAARHYGEATRTLIRELHEQSEKRHEATQALIKEIHQAAETRHSEVIQAIQAIAGRMA
jgi:hypothetical protein